jgi:hypothetical protein
MEHGTDPNSLAADLPSDDATTRSLSTHLFLQLTLPAEARVRLPSLGDVMLQMRLLAPKVRAAWEAGERGGSEVFAIADPDRIGHLYVENRLAATVVSALLGLPPPVAGGRLSRLERGLLTGVLAVVLAKAEFALPVRICDVVDTGSVAGPFVLRISADVRGECGQVWLVAGDELVTRIRATPWLRRSEVTPWIEIGATSIDAMELADAEPGDRLVFDEAKGLSSTAAWPVMLQNDFARVSACWLPSGLLVAAADPGEVTFAHGSRALAAPAARPKQRVVRAVVDCDRSRGPGALWARRDAAIALRTDDEIVAYGTRSEHDGAFAVLITRKPAG